MPGKVGPLHPRRGTKEQLSGKGPELVVGSLLDMSPCLSWKQRCPTAPRVYWELHFPVRKLSLFSLEKAWLWGPNTSPASLKVHQRDRYKLLTLVQDERVHINRFKLKQGWSRLGITEKNLFISRIIKHQSRLPSQIVETSKVRIFLI